MKASFGVDLTGTNVGPYLICMRVLQDAMLHADYHFPQCFQSKMVGLRLVFYVDIRHEEIVIRLMYWVELSECRTKLVLHSHHEAGGCSLNLQDTAKVITKAAKKDLEFWGYISNKLDKHLDQYVLDYREGHALLHELGMCH